MQREEAYVYSVLRKSYVNMNSDLHPATVFENYFIEDDLESNGYVLFSYILYYRVAFWEIYER